MTRGKSLPLRDFWGQAGSEDQALPTPPLCLPLPPWFSASIYWLEKSPHLLGCLGGSWVVILSHASGSQTATRWRPARTQTKRQGTWGFPALLQGLAWQC